MFEKFTRRAQKVVELAREEARRSEREFIGTDMMLMGLLLEGHGAAARVLENLQVTPRSVREEIDRVSVPPSAGFRAELAFSPRLRRVFQLADETAGGLNHDEIGTEHLLLGLLKEKEGTAFEILVNLGLVPEQVAGIMIEVLGTYPGESGSGAVEKPAEP